MKRIRVLLADDHRLMIAAVRAALEGESDLEVVGSTMDATRVVSLVAELAPDVVVLDVMMPRIDGIKVLERIRARFPAVRVVMLSAGEPGLAAKAEASGASAFAHKQIDPALLPGILRDAVSDEIFRCLGAPVDEQDQLAVAAGLTLKEEEVLGALGRGLSNKLIAKELGVTEQTVKFHLSNVYRKLDVSNRTSAAQFALRHGLADSAPTTGPAG